jgi:hypothetical protein
MTQTVSVYCAVRFKSLNTIHVNRIHVLYNASLLCTYFLNSLKYSKTGNVALRSTVARSLTTVAVERQQFIMCVLLSYTSYLQILSFVHQ